MSDPILAAPPVTGADSASSVTAPDRSGRCPACLSPRVGVVREREGFPIQRCAACGTDSAVLRRDQLPSYDAHYEDATHYGGYHNMVAAARAGDEPLYWYQPRMLREAGPGGGRVHVDVGSGLGTFLAISRKQGWSPLGVDVSPAAAAGAESSFGIDTHVGDLLDLPQPPGGVGWVSAFEVMEHAFAPRDYVRHMRRLLTPGGLVTVSVPNGRSRQERHTRNPIMTPPTHVNFFSRKGLRRMFEEEGFTTAYDYAKPIAWGEISRPKAVKVAMLPLLVLDRALLGHGGNRLLWVGRKAA